VANLNTPHPASTPPLLVALHRRDIAACACLLEIDAAQREIDAAAATEPALRPLAERLRQRNF